VDVTGTATVSGLVTASAALTVTTGNLTISSGDLTLSSGNVGVTGTATISGLVTASAALTVTTGNLTISSGDLTLSSGNVGVTGTATISGLVTASAALTVTTGNLTVSSGNVDITGTLTASGLVTASAALTVTTGALTVSAGDVSITGSKIVMDPGADEEVFLKLIHNSGGAQFGLDSASGNMQIRQLSNADVDEQVWVSGTLDAGASLYFGGNEKLVTTLETATGFGTGAKVRDGLDTFQPVGYNVMPLYSHDTVDAFDLAHNGMVWHKNSSTSRVWTINSDTTIPVGATYLIVNEGSETIVLTDGTITALKWFDGGAVTTSATVTVGTGGVATLYKKTDSEWWVWGIGLS